MASLAGWCVAEEAWALTCAYWGKREDKLVLISRDGHEKVPVPEERPDMKAVKTKINQLRTFQEESDKQLVLKLVGEFSAGLQVRQGVAAISP